MQILVINFGIRGLSDAELRALATQLAPAFKAVPGLERKYWLADPDSGTYGGVYVFDGAASIDAYLEGDLFTGLKANPNVTNVTVRRFGTIEEATAITQPEPAAAAA